ncbi:MAG: endonuclease, partial [Winogradskyella sp.]|nr:endonuclease [Winogradskyella sp.]
IKPDVESLKKEDSQNLIISLANTFKKQQAQTELLLQHMNDCPYKIIISGDLNNTPYSYVYNQIKGDLLDTFDEAGQGFGKTFNQSMFPLRIDFILVDDTFEVNSFKVFKKNYSDHYPIMTSISLH